MKSTQNDPAYERRIPKEILPVVKSFRDASISVTPCYDPPSRSSVSKWLKRQRSPCNTVTEVKSDSTVEAIGLSCTSEFSINVSYS